MSPVARPVLKVDLAHLMPLLSVRRSKKTATVRGESVTTTTHHATVELSTKVTDTASKLRHTLAHELCHLAAWAIDGEMKPPHGAAFKRWCVGGAFFVGEAPLTGLVEPLSRRAKRVMIVRPDIEVTTTHAYEIVYKYRWKCVSAVCGKMCVLTSSPSLLRVRPDAH